MGAGEDCRRFKGMTFFPPERKSDIIYFLLVNCMQFFTVNGAGRIML
jgi:hypothetical protein